MKKMLRAIVNWLDRKFPDKVVLTVDKFKAMEAEVKRHAELLAAYDEHAKKNAERLQKIEAEINKFNASMGFNKVVDKFQIGAFQR